MIGTAELLLLARAYANAHSVSFTTISSRVFNDGKKLDAIAGGADLYSSRLNRAIQWFSDNWPADLPWPEGLTRPAPTPVEA